MRWADAALCAIALFALGGALAFTWQPGLASLHDDSVSYLLMAQWYAPWQAVAPSVAAAAPLEKYPPLFPLLLALGGGAFDWRIAHALVAASFVASVLLLGVHARKITASAMMGTAAALVFALMPGAWLNLKGILSEFPYMALSFAAIVAHERQRRRPPSRRAAILLGLLLAGALMTRTIGVALLVAIAAAELLRARRSTDPARVRLLAWTFGVPLACAALWYVLRPAAGEDAYATFAAQVAGDANTEGATRLIAMAQVNLAAISDAWLASMLIFWGEWWKPGFLVATALGIIALLATVRRAAQGEMDALYCLAFTAILVAWPFPGQMLRLALPVVPLVMVNMLWAWQRLLLRMGVEGALQRAPLAAVLPLGLCVPAMLFYVVERGRAATTAPGSTSTRDITEFYRIPSGPSAAANAAAQVGVFEDMRRIRDLTPEGARVMWYAPAYISLLAQRHGVVLQRPRDAADLAAQAIMANADYIYLAAIHPRDSGRRLGNPLEPLALAREFTDVVFQRGFRGGEMQAVLLRVDRDRAGRKEARP